MPRRQGRGIARRVILTVNQNAAHAGDLWYISLQPLPAPIIKQRGATLDDNAKLRMIRRKTRQRLAFALVTLLLYFSFALNWTAAGRGLSTRLGDSWVTGSLLMFAVLIILFIVMELVYLRLNRRGAMDRAGD
jgi:uncharacterized membrane protein (DUF485 family)